MRFFGVVRPILTGSRLEPAEGWAMVAIREILRLPSPAPKPQSLAFDGELLWMGSRETRTIYAIEPRTWTVREEVAAPGTPWGMAVVGDELRVLCGEGDDDTRMIRRFVPGHGFKSGDALPVPEDTGSQLGFDGDRLFVSQFYRRRILGIAADGTVTNDIPVPHDVCGQVVVDGRFYLATTDDERHGAYWITRLDARGGAPVSSDLATIGFPARALAFDGERFWTNQREADEIVAFRIPDRAD